MNLYISFSSSSLSGRLTEPGAGEPQYPPLAVRFPSRIPTAVCLASSLLSSSSPSLQLHILFPLSIFAFLLLTPDFSGLYYFVVFEKEREREGETPELQPRWSALPFCPDHCPLARVPLSCPSRPSLQLPSACPPLVRTRIPLDSWTGGSESFMVV